MKRLKSLRSLFMFSILLGLSVGLESAQALQVQFADSSRVKNRKSDTLLNFAGSSSRQVTSRSILSSRLEGRLWEAQIALRNHKLGGAVEVEVHAVSDNRTPEYSEDFAETNGGSFVLCQNGLLNTSCFSNSAINRHCSNTTRSQADKQRCLKQILPHSGCERLRYARRKLYCSLKDSVKDSTKKQLLSQLLPKKAEKELLRVTLQPGQKLSRKLRLNSKSSGKALRFRVVYRQVGVQKNRPVFIDNFQLRPVQKKPELSAVNPQKLLSWPRYKRHKVLKQMIDTGAKHIRLNFAGFYKVATINGRKYWERDILKDTIEFLNNHGIKPALRVKLSPEDYLKKDRAYFNPWHYNLFYKYPSVWNEFERAVKENREPEISLNQKQLTVFSPQSFWGRGYILRVLQCPLVGAASIRHIHKPYFKARLRRYMKFFKDSQVEIASVGFFNEMNKNCSNADVLTADVRYSESQKSELLEVFDERVRNSLSNEAVLHYTRKFGLGNGNEQQWQKRNLLLNHIKAKIRAQTFWESERRFASFNSPQLQSRQNSLARSSARNYAQLIRAFYEILYYNKNLSSYMRSIKVGLFPFSMDAKLAELHSSGAPVAGAVAPSVFFRELDRLSIQGRSVLSHLDAIALNLYPNFLPPQGSTEAEKAIFDNTVGKDVIQTEIRESVRFMHAQSPVKNKKIWIGEFGFHTTYNPFEKNAASRVLRTSRGRFESYLNFVDYVYATPSLNVERMTVFSWDMWRNPLSFSFYRYDEEAGKVKLDDSTDSSLPEASILAY